MKRNTNKKSGFTLVELVVVVAIIGVLAAIVTPKFRVSLMKSKDAKVVATLQTLKTAANVYYAEKGTLPSGNVPTAGQLLTAADLVRLQNANYLSQQDVNKITLGKTDNTTVAIQAGVVQDVTVPANCVNNGNGTYSPNSSPAFTPGNVGFVWAADGIGITAVGLDAKGNAFANGADTGCQLWTTK